MVTRPRAIVIARTPTMTGRVAATKAPNATISTASVRGTARCSLRSVSSALMVRTSWSSAGKPVTITSKSSEPGTRPSACSIVARRSGTKLVLRSRVDAGVMAAIRKVVRRSLLTKVDSPIERTEITWLTYARRSAALVRESSTASNQRFEAVLDSLTRAAERRAYVSQVISVRSIGESTFVSKDRRTTFLIAAITPASTRDLSTSFVPDLRATIEQALGRVPGSEDFEVMVTGFPALDHDVRTISAEDTERSEQRAVPLTLAVLIVAFGALVAATLPVIVGVLAITIALGLVTIAAHYLPMSVFVLNITTMVGLGVGIDYSLLVVTRFREELNRGLSPVDAAIRTVETAGSAV